MSQYILILGASSDIAKALARRYAKEKYNFYLAGRNIEELKKDAADLSIRYGVQAVAVPFDMTSFTSHAAFYASLEPKPTGIICVAGYLGEQKRAEQNFEEAYKIMATNFTGCVSILNIVANELEAARAGFIIGISSVAGDRGRASNYLYGSAKAGFTTYLSGLRNRLSKAGVQVITVKPGFVNTKMTEGLSLNPALTAKPDEVAKDIYNAQVKGKDIIYTKWFWRYIMLIITSIPEKIFKKLSL
jgi:decaprenylphospho-beta-D-erythro-pentofuranosid-2-ulose 2-reductase